MTEYVPRDWTQYLTHCLGYHPHSKFNISFKGLSGKLDLVEIFNSDPTKYNKVKWIDCSGNHLTELILPKGIIGVFCSNNQLKELILPEGIKTIFCDYNKLTELILPNSVERFSCGGNYLTELKVPNGITGWCFHNYLPEPFSHQRPKNELIDKYTTLLKEYYEVDYYVVEYSKEIATTLVL